MMYGAMYGDPAELPQEAVVAAKVVMRAARRSGCSSGITWPQPGTTSRRAPGSAAALRRPAASGKNGSRSPQTTSVGRPSDGSARSIGPYSEARLVRLPANEAGEAPEVCHDHAE